MLSHARMLPHRIMRTIGELSIGDEAWACSDAMAVDDDGLCWIDTEYTCSPVPSSYYTMKIVKDEYGFVVDISNVPPDIGWWTGDYEDDESEYEPVLRLIEEPEPTSESAEPTIRDTQNIVGVAWK